MALADKPPRLPPPHIPVVDPKTGLMNKHWYDYYVALASYQETLRAAIP